MDWKMCVARFAAIFEKRISRRISQSELSKKAKHSRGFVSRLKRHARGMRIGDFAKLLSAAGDEMPEDGLVEVVASVPADPPRILASNRKRQGLEPSPFLASIARHVLALVDAGPSPGRRWRRRIATLRQFEKLRFTDQALARHKLERIAGLGVALLERSPSRPPAALADLACAFICLAVVYRSAGRLDDAVDSYLLAWPLMQLAGDPLVEGLWYKKAAYLLVYLDRCDRAREFLKEASVRFVAAAAAVEQTHVLVDLGFVESRAFRSAEACHWLRLALRLLPESEREYRFNAHQILGKNLALLGHVQEAICHLETAGGLADRDSLFLAGVTWSRARLCAARGANETARNAFQSAFDLYTRHGSPVDLAQLSCDYVAFLIGEKNRPEFERLAAGISNYLSTSGCDREIREFLEDLMALGPLRRFTISALEKLRKRLPQSDEECQYRAACQSLQPPTGTSSPLSGSSPVAKLLFGGNSPLVESPPSP